MGLISLNSLFWAFSLWIFCGEFVTIFIPSTVRDRLRCVCLILFVRQFTMQLLEYEYFSTFFSNTALLIWEMAFGAFAVYLLKGI